MECDFCSEIAEYVITAEVIRSYESWIEFVCPQHFVERGMTIEAYNAGEEPMIRVVATRRLW